MLTPELPLEDGDAVDFHPFVLNSCGEEEL